MHYHLVRAGGRVKLQCLEAPFMQEVVDVDLDVLCCEGDCFYIVNHLWLCGVVAHAIASANGLEVLG